MPTQVTKIQVFVASPGDVEQERERLGAVVQELNSAVAASINVVLELVKFETHTHPGMGIDPQDVVNQQIRPSDVFIGIMWKRFGTKTKRAESGTLEEFERARARWKSNPDMDILFYFNETPYFLQTKQETNQAGKVLAFKKSLGKTALTCNYKGVQEFESLVRRHLTQVLLNWHKKQTPALAIAQPAGGGQKDENATAARPQPLSALPSTTQPTSSGVSIIKADSPQDASIVSLDLVYERLLSDDPAQSIPAAEQIMQALSLDVSHLLVNIHSKLRVPREFAIRLLLSKFAERSAPLMIKKVLNAASDWHEALAVSDLFTPAHRKHAADALAKELTSQVAFDVGRLCIESLGHMGANDWSYRLLELIGAGNDPVRSYFNEYTYGKYYSYVIEALARMFVLSQDDWYGEPSVDALKDGLHFLEKHGSLQNNSLLRSSIAPILGKGKPAHGDVLLKRWITSENPYLKELAISAVGFMRFSRATQALEEIAQDASADDFLSGQALLALSNIRTPDSIGTVIAAFEKGPQKLSALAAARCLEAVEDEDMFRGLCRKLLDFDVMEKCWVFRACGLRKATEFCEPILAALNSSEGSERAHAALALARLDPAKHRSRLARAYEEASHHMDKILSGLALMLVPQAPYPDIIVELRKQLPIMSWLYQRQTREDIVNVLMHHKSPEARLLGSSWKQVYTGSQDY